jgi:hypothetical protein
VDLDTVLGLAMVASGLLVLLGELALGGLLAYLGVVLIAMGC